MNTTKGTQTTQIGRMFANFFQKYKGRKSGWYLLLSALVASSAFWSPAQASTFPADTITDYYEVETIALPKGLRGEVGALDFLPDGRLVACFRRGEVMLYNPKTKAWKLYAEGMHDPLGILANSPTDILVMQRPELTRLKDTNGDGVADDYQTVYDGFGLSGNYHEFAFGPVRDREGNLVIGDLVDDGA